MLGIDRQGDQLAGRGFDLPQVGHVLDLEDLSFYQYVLMHRLAHILAWLRVADTDHVILREVVAYDLRRVVLDPDAAVLCYPLGVVPEFLCLPVYVFCTVCTDQDTVVVFIFERLIGFLQHLCCDPCVLRHVCQVQHQAVCDGVIADRIVVRG